MATDNGNSISWTRQEFIDEFGQNHFETFVNVVTKFNLEKIKIACLSVPAIIFRNYMMIDVPWGREYCALDMTGQVEDGRFKARIETITFFNDHSTYMIDKIEKEGREQIINEN